MAQKLLVAITGDASSLSRAFSKASGDAQTFGQKLAGVGSKMTSVGKSMTLGITLPLAAAGVASFKMADDFETSMSRVIGLAGQSEEQVDKWSKQLLKIGPELARSPRELADALYFVASSGVSASKVMNVVTVSAKAASAGLGETEQVADTLTSVMNAYGEANISAAHAADVLVATVREGKGEASDFAPVIGNVTAFASKLGVSFEDVGGALAAMTQLGTDAATAATQLQAVFSQLVKETPQGAKALESVGLSYEGLRKELKEKGLLATLGTLNTAFDGNVSAMSKVFGNVRALRALFALVGDDTGRVAAIFNRMGESTGSLATAFEESTKRTGFTMEKFKASIEAAGIAIGTILAPIAAKVATFLTRLSIAFQNLSPEAQKIIIAVAAVAAVMGPVLIIVGSLVGAIGALIPVFAALASPIGIVVIAVVALVAALVAAVLWPDKLQAALQRMGLSAKDAKSTVEALRNAFTAIKAVVQAVMPAILSIVKPALDLIRGALMIVSALLRGDFADAWKGIKIVVAAELRLLVALMTAFPRVLLGLAAKFGEAIVRGIGNGLAALPGLIRSFIGKIPGWIASYYSFVASAAFQLGQALIQGIVNGLSGLAGAVKDKIIGGIQGAIDGAMGIFGHSPQEMIGVALVDGVVKGWNAQQAKGGLKSAMVDGVNSAIDAAQQAISDKQGAFASAFDGLVSAALSAFDKITSEFETKTERLIRKQDEARAAAERQSALAQAKTGLAEATAGGDPEAIKAAQQALDDALFAIQRFNQEKRAAQERKHYEASREQQRVTFEKQLENMKKAYLNQELTTQQFHQNMIALFKKNEIPFNKAANKLGAALAAGLNDSFDQVDRAARNLAATIVKRLSEITVKVNIELQDIAGGVGPAGKQAGGPVRSGTPYIVGEAGPELFVPKSSGYIHSNGATAGMAAGGGTQVNLVFNGPTVGTSRDFEDTVRRALYDVSRRNPGIGFAT